MATKKTPPTSESTAQRAQKPAAASKKPAAARTTKPRKASTVKASAPVILDPPGKAASTKPAKKPETIDVKAVEVKPARVKDTAAPVAKPKPETSSNPTPPKPDAAKSERIKPSPREPLKPITPQKAAPANRMTAIWMFVLGAVIAGGGSYVATSFAPTTSGSSDQLLAIERQLADAENRVLALENTAVPVPVLSSIQSQIDQLSTALSQQQADFDQRLLITKAEFQAALDTLEATRSSLINDLGDSGVEIGQATLDIIARYGAEIEAMKAQIASQIQASDELTARFEAVSETAARKLDAAQTKVAELAEVAKTTARSVDLSLAAERLRAAVETGKSYADVLARIAGEAAVAIPDALQNGAQTGVAPLLQLQKDFPDAARRALKVSIRANAGDGLGQKLAAFLQSQIGARSLEEKEGDDPDAVLSRAEAALERGELGTAIDLIHQLPDVGIAEMQDWLTAAKTRMSVQTALEEFSKTLGSQD